MAEKQKPESPGKGEGKQGKQKKEAPPQQQVKAPKMGNIVRVAETNLDGGKRIRAAVRGVPGVGFMMGNAVGIVSGLGDRKLEELSEEELKRLEEVIHSPQKFGIPSWMLNRRFDPLQGKDRHLVASTLEFARKMDINEMKKLKTYKGIRHGLGLPVRGQRTRSSFRKGKTIGVKRQKQAPAKAGEAKKEKVEKS